MRSAFSHWIIYNNIGFNEFIAVYTTIFTIQIKVYNTFRAPEHSYMPIPKQYFSCLSQCVIWFTSSFICACFLNFLKQNYTIGILFLTVFHTAQHLIFIHTLICYQWFSCIVFHCIHCHQVIHALVHGHLDLSQGRASLSVVAELLINILEYSFMVFFFCLFQRIFEPWGKKYLVWLTPLNTLPVLRHESFSFTNFVALIFVVLISF